MHCVFMSNTQLCPLLMAQYPFCLFFPIIPFKFTWTDVCSVILVIIQPSERHPCVLIYDYIPISLLFLGSAWISLTSGFFSTFTYCKVLIIEFVVYFFAFLFNLACTYHAASPPGSEQEKFEFALNCKRRALTLTLRWANTHSYLLQEEPASISFLEVTESNNVNKRSHGG